MKFKWVGILLLLFVLVLSFPQTVNAQGLSCEKFILGGTYSLEEGENLPGNLCLLAGVGTLESGSVVEGDVLLIGGNLHAYGEIDGNLTIAGGTVDFSDATQVVGDLRLFGGQVFGLELASIDGNVFRNFNLPYSYQVPAPGWPNFSGWLQPLWRLFWLPIRSILWVGFALLMYLIVPKRVKLTGKTARNQPVMSGVVGLGTILVVAFAALLLAITVICIPISLILILAFLLSWGAGIVALGNVSGEYLEKLFKQDWAPMVRLGIGVFTLTFIVNITGLAVSCLGVVLMLLFGAVGLGAVVLTRFGVQPYLAREQVSSGNVSNSAPSDESGEAPLK